MFKNQKQTKKNDQRILDKGKYNFVKEKKIYLSTECI